MKHIRTVLDDETGVKVDAKAKKDGITKFEALRLLLTSYANGEISIVTRVRKTSLHNQTPKVTKNVAKPSSRKASIHNISSENHS